MSDIYYVFGCREINNCNFSAVNIRKYFFKKIMKKYFNY